MALNAKHILFVNDYMISQNVTASYQKVYGCTEDAARKAGSRLLTNVDIKSEIVRRQEEVNKKVEEDTGISVQWVLESFKTVADRCMQAEEIKDKEGNGTGEWRFDSSGANKAIESIGRYFGMFNDKLKVDANNNNLNTDLTNLQPDERRARIDELNRRRGTGTHTAS
jgi:phage terminase small subunit